MDERVGFVRVKRAGLTYYLNISPQRAPGQWEYTCNVLPKTVNGCGKVARSADPDKAYNHYGYEDDE